MSIYKKINRRGSKISNLDAKLAVQKTEGEDDEENKRNDQNHRKCSRKPKRSICVFRDHTVFRDSQNPLPNVPDQEKDIETK